MVVRLLRTVLAVALALPAVGLTSPAALPTDCAAAAGALHHVAVVVEHQNHAVVRVCVGFSGPAIGAEAALRASGLNPGVNGSGGLGDEVCEIDGEPATYDPQECLYPGKPFWALWVSRSGGAWSPSSVGVSSLTLGDGDAEGWHYDLYRAPAPPPPAGTCAGPVRRPPTPRPPAAATTPPSTSPVPAAHSASASPVPAPAVALLPSGQPSVSAGPLVRSGPALARPAEAGSSVAGWLLLGLIVIAGVGVLATQLWRRSRLL